MVGPEVQSEEPFGWPKTEGTHAHMRLAGQTFGHSRVKGRPGRFHLCAVWQKCQTALLILHWQLAIFSMCCPLHIVALPALLRKNGGLKRNSPENSLFEGIDVHLCVYMCIYVSRATDLDVWTTLHSFRQISD